MTKDILMLAYDDKTFHGIQERFAMDGIKVFHVDSKEEAVWKIQVHNYCMLILDTPFLDETEMKNIAVFREMSSMPIFVLSEEASVADRVEVLKKGADDFLQKPYDIEECMARAWALLRRYTELNYAVTSQYEIVSYGGLLLDTGQRCLSDHGKEIKLTPKEYGILELLMKKRRQIMTYEQIYETVWNDNYLGVSDKEAVFFHVGRLRRKIGAERIESVYGIGYRLKESVI